MTKATLKDDMKRGIYGVNFREIIPLTESERGKSNWFVCHLKTDFLSHDNANTSQMIITLDFSDVENLLPAIAIEYNKWKQAKEAESKLTFPSI